MFLLQGVTLQRSWLISKMLSEASPAGNWALGITVAVTLVATLFVALRFWARNTTRFGLWLDDWLALATLVVLYWVLIISAIAVDKGGIGKPIAQAMTENSLTLLLQVRDRPIERNKDQKYLITDQPSASLGI